MRSVDLTEGCRGFGERVQAAWSTAAWGGGVRRVETDMHACVVSQGLPDIIYNRNHCVQIQSLLGLKVGTLVCVELPSWAVFLYFLHLPHAS